MKDASTSTVGRSALGARHSVLGQAPNADPRVPDAQRVICAVPGTPLDFAKAGIDACVHCGFCLQACPTYLALADENDSPRGRILLMRAVVEGSLAPDDPSVRTHIDRCLGCRGCETACPSGVPYGHLLEATRATIAGKHPLVARLVLWVFRKEWALRPALAAAKLLRATRLPAVLGRMPGKIGFAMAMLDSTRPAVQRETYAPASAGTRGSVAVLLGCVMEGLFDETNRATERVLAANDWAITAAPGQRCCGALHAHAGDLDAARELARVNIDAFERSGAETIAVNAAGCGAMMKEYAQLLADDPVYAERAARVSARVRDVSELLAVAGPARGGSLPLTVTYDAPCHLLHAQRVVAPPLAVLKSIPGLTMVPLVESDQCCGAAGIYNLVEPEVSGAVLEPKLAHIARTGASLVATGNPGCLMQIGAGLARTRSAVRAVHPVDLLDASYAARERDGTAEAR
ncbi:MAG TPA: heterodisulfide reductase-related iron-sulfur binding cluster [Gemmatimonadaceae bacterium]|nr:heterodisulfide reductase-related iron-sulfur binding cluster [Gemmatimonadaceae bacterium]